jgi:hypothetical protein
MDERASLKKHVSAYLDTLAPFVFYEKREPSMGGRSGVSDYIGCAWGAYFAIEIKHPVSRPALNPEQKFFHEKIGKARGRILAAYSVADVMQFMGDIAEEYAT